MEQEFLIELTQIMGPGHLYGRDMLLRECAQAERVWSVARTGTLVCPLQEERWLLDRVAKCVKLSLA